MRVALPPRGHGLPGCSHATEGWATVRCQRWRAPLATVELSIGRHAILTVRRVGGNRPALQMAASVMRVDVKVVRR